jgi:transcriptional regulator with XRE-family HTH domain
MVSFGKRLKYLRKKKGLTQKELSKILNVSESSISMYEREDREPSFETLKQIADFFGVSRAFLLGDPEPSQKNDEDLLAFFNLNDLDEDDIQYLKDTIEFLRRKNIKKR